MTPQLLLVALVCAVGTPRVDCMRATALDVIVQPAASAIPTACLLEGEARLASGALELAPGTYPLFRCERRR
ncbi:hypothetical protein OPKNFCMD_3818 [Methylobacterium crusticola]|uniref:Ribosomal protein S27 n=1 Tax=Methylobacterium crusticola TaxID=1697972 RepID=A0ABQ4R2S8_9HYPH|nr:hypothetical protein [Methylobacterium crusticola]GJD51067.1 hypothetical protein OPKNFCMD_3818 [Methylobacterium crusticola]